MQLRSAMQLELERFFDRLADGQADNVPVGSAFTKAREKLKASAFIALNQTLQRVFADHTTGHTQRTHWRGLRLRAVDGSTVRLPNSEEIVDHFGGMQPAKGAFVSMARLSLLYDVLTEVVVAGAITPYGHGEEFHLEGFLDEHVRAGDCLILDRGYFDQLLPALIAAKGGHFVMRVGVGQWQEARAFADSKAKECRVKFKVPLWVKEEWKEEGIDLPEVIEARLIRVELSSGEVEVLLTDLIDPVAYPAEEFDGIYHKRWSVEEGYKTLKCKVEIENWTGKTVHSVEQDFHAAILLMNIVQTLAFFKRPEVDQASEESKHAYKINVKRGLALVRDRMAALFVASASRSKKLLELLGNRLLKALSLVRPERSYPRKVRPRRPYSPPNKPIS